MSGFVGEEIMVLALGEQTISERRIGKELPCVGLPRNGIHAPGLRPEPAEGHIVEEAPACAGRGILLQLDFTLGADDIDDASGIEREVVEEPVIMQDTIRRSARGPSRKGRDPSCPDAGSFPHRKGESAAENNDRRRHCDERSPCAACPRKH